jgi:hypothetical protein
VQPPRRFADQLGKSCFNIEVNVLEFFPEWKCAGRKFLLDQIEPTLNFGFVRVRNDLLGGQHRGVRPRSNYILGSEPAIESKRNVDRSHQLARAVFEPTAP